MRLWHTTCSRFRDGNFDAAEELMGFGEAIATCFRKYVSARGRATRPEFWYWILFTFLVNIASSIVDGVIAASANLQGFAFVSAITSLILFLPGVAVTLRRLHDTDHSGWWYFLPMTVIGAIPFLIWMCREGTPGANRFGLGSRGDIAGVFGGEASAATLSDQRV